MKTFEVIEKEYRSKQMTASGLEKIHLEDWKLFREKREEIIAKHNEERRKLDKEEDSLDETTTFTKSHYEAVLCALSVELEENLKKVDAAYLAAVRDRCLLTDDPSKRGKK